MAGGRSHASHLGSLAAARVRSHAGAVSFPHPRLIPTSGSEFINYQVSGLLNELPIEQTKSRPLHSGDNALVESKSGSVIREHLGWTHIASRHADPSISSIASISIRT